MNKLLRIMALPLLMVSACLSFHSCSKWRQSIDEFNDILDEMVATVDQASEEWQGLIREESEVWADLIDINSEEWQLLVGGESEEWRKLFSDKSDDWIAVADSFRSIARDFQVTADDLVISLNKINNDLPSHIQLAAHDLQKALNNVSGTLTGNILCATDVMEGKAQSWIGQIQAELGLNYNQSYKSNEELKRLYICSSDITSINLSLPKSRWEEITIFGYGFDQSIGNLEVVFSNELGSQHNASNQILFKNSNYRLLIILDGMSPQQLRLFNKFSLIYDNDHILSEIPITN